MNAAIGAPVPLGIESRALGVMKALVAHPAVFGVGVGVANGLLATMRNKPVSIRANVVTALVVGAGEAVLLEDKSKVVTYGLLSALGASLGLALFTRWDPYNRAIIEKDAVPAPPLPPAVASAVAQYGA
jgi:hypothetical protein